MVENLYFWAITETIYFNSLHFHILHRKLKTKGKTNWWRLLSSHTFGFRLMTLEGMHQFHLNFTEGSSIVKYRSSSKKWVIRKILTEL